MFTDNIAKKVLRITSDNANFYRLNETMTGTLLLILSDSESEANIVKIIFIISSRVWRKKEWVSPACRCHFRSAGEKDSSVLIWSDRDSISVFQRNKTKRMYNLRETASKR